MRLVLMYRTKHCGPFSPLIPPYHMDLALDPLSSAHDRSPLIKSEKTKSRQYLTNTV
jgi:hypothetical protein